LSGRQKDHAMTQFADRHPQPIDLPNSIRIGTAATTPSAAPATVTAAATCRPSPRSDSDPVNADETTHAADYRGNFTKGLEHDPATGFVLPARYQEMVATLQRMPRNPDDYGALPLHLGRPFVNPQAGKATDVMGPNPRQMAMASPPTVDSREAAVEAIELYWMALVRDTPFASWDTDPLIAAAAAEMTTHEADYYGPTIAGAVTPGTVFRGCSPGDNVGPYISQFLLRDIPYGSLTINQQQRTAVGGVDYLRDQASWLAAQNGAPINSSAQHDMTPRYIRNLRDLAEYVHVDALYEAYLNACLILLHANAPLNPGNPYNGSSTQIGFGTWGGPHILSLVCEVATRALKCVWWHKWYMHRRLRPEAYGGLVFHGQLDPSNPVFGSDALARTEAAPGGSRLLPMAFPEGSPTHPAYGAGHATVAGACVTILKAFFDENATISDVVQPSEDGLSLLPMPGVQLTVGGELNKVAANIALGRNAGGVHWRSDYTDSLALGERIALYILRQQAGDYHEDWSAHLTRFDGTTVEIGPHSEHDA
jgi:hypothetical protein